MRRAYCHWAFLLLPLLSFLNTSCTEVQSSQENNPVIITKRASAAADTVPVKKVLDTAMYDKIVREIVDNDTTSKWPVKAPYPLPDAVLPFHRIVAFYGNLYSKRMGILGELPK